MKKLLVEFGVASAFLFTSHVAIAGTLSGIVRDSSGQTLQGVMIRLTDPLSGISESVFSNRHGEYVLSTSLSGELTLRARIPYHKDVSMTVDLIETAKVHRDVSMELMTDETEISDSLPAAYHFGSLDFETGEDAVFSRYQFQRDCLSCHCST